MSLNTAQLISIIFIIGLTSCRGTHRNRVIVIQPLGAFSPALASKVSGQLKEINANTILRSSIPLPATAYYKPRNRYRADTLIRILSQRGDADTVIIGMTEEDISTTKNKKQDWGVMGLGYRPGNACVASTFRLAKSNVADQFYKVAIHELGHTQGLEHCKDKTCFMRDAEGGNPLNEEKDFVLPAKPF